ncbi:29458_t:CDS:2, partial [Gigaspora margarita]
ENIRDDIEFYRDNISQRNIRDDIEFYKDKMNKKLINKSLTEKLLFITSFFCHYPDDNSAEIVIELHNRLKNMPKSLRKGKELHLSGLQDLILEKYVDYAGYTAKSKCILQSGLKNHTTHAWHNTIDRYIERNDNSLELSAIENMFQIL